MSEEGLPPKEATRKAMSQITGAIIGITLVLIAVFLPMAFFPGSVGIIYRQFSVTMVAAIALLRAAGDVADAGAVRDAAEAGHGRPWPRPQGRVRLVQSRARQRQGRLCAHRGLVAEAHRTADADLCRAADRAGLGLRSPARRLPSRRRSGLYHHRRADAGRFLLCAHRGRGREGRKISGAARRRRERDVPHRLQLSRPGHQHRAGLHHAEGLVGASGRRIRRPPSSPTSTAISSSIRDARISALQPPPIDNLGNSSGFSFPPAGPRPEGLSGAGRRRRPADRGSQCEPGAAEGLCRRPAAGAAGQPDDRPRKGRRLRRHLRGHQQHDLDQSRIELHQRLSEPRPDAAGDRAGRSTAAA